MIKIATLLGFLQVLPEVKKVVQGCNLKAPVRPSKRRLQKILTHVQCEYVGHVYGLFVHHNTTFPQEPISAESLVRYFNHLFEVSIPLNQYQKIWQHYQPKG